MSLRPRNKDGSIAPLLAWGSKFLKEAEIHRYASAVGLAPRVHDARFLYDPPTTLIAQIITDYLDPSEGWIEYTVYKATRGGGDEALEALSKVEKAFGKMHQEAFLTHGDLRGGKNVMVKTGRDGRRVRDVKIIEWGTAMLHDQKTDASAIVRAASDLDAIASVDSSRRSSCSTATKTLRKQQLLRTRTKGTLMRYDQALTAARKKLMRPSDLRSLSEQMSSFIRSSLPVCSSAMQVHHLLLSREQQKKVQTLIEKTAAELRCARREVLSVEFRPPTRLSDFPRWNAYVRASQKSRHRGFGEMALLHTTSSVEDARNISRSGYFDISRQQECSSVHGYGVTADFKKSMGHLPTQNTTKTDCCNSSS